jgi:hypothetical protein
MQLYKTDRARAELKPGTRTLGQRERTLLLADGSKSVPDFRPLFNGDGEQIALRLLRDGFLEAHPGKQLLAETTVASTPLKTAPNQLHRPSAQLSDPLVALQQAQQQHFPSPETTQVTKVSADQFEGKRSLATTRMFLFDICERMFARRNPQLAELFREALRQAKDRDTMLAVSRDMIGEIEIVAGHERADSISERLAMLLPVSAPESTTG